ncbi:DUF308 domain-containing protein [Cyanobacteria bacterium FACHB-DQ100]|nr:DUF308 domain-containing protein [Cyanobacteria bacterium FACHB-DQ100]
MTASIEQPKSRNGALWSGILLIALGLGAVVAPVFSTLVSETWIALIILSAGFTKLVYAVQTRNQGGFLWKILLSSLYIATGIMLFASPLTGVLTLTLLLGSFLLTEGAFELILAFRMREQKNWFWLLGNAIITAGLGALIWSQYPSNAPWLLGTLVGASIFASGLSRVMFSLNPQAQSETPATSA